jgi:hypothetical protein
MQVSVRVQENVGALAANYCLSVNSGVCSGTSNEVISLPCPAVCLPEEPTIEAITQNAAVSADGTVQYVHEQVIFNEPLLAVLVRWALNIRGSANFYRLDVLLHTAGSVISCVATSLVPDRTIRDKSELESKGVISRYEPSMLSGLTITLPRRYLGADAQIVGNGTPVESIVPVFLTAVQQGPRPAKLPSTEKR